ncbi:MAG TPA: HlyD family secretion protein [Rhizobiaceae bacterium]|nr:HlyD family secretion protein [Rhizobiaceae bacterium]
MATRSRNVRTGSENANGGEADVVAKEALRPPRDAPRDQDAGGKNADGQEIAGRNGDRPTPETKRPGFLRRHPLLAALIVVLLVIVTVAGVLWWLHSRQYESTDDAFIDTRTVTISSQISGLITAVPVTDNQAVKAGTVLVRIDDSDYRASLEQANAQVAEAEAAIANSDAQIEAQVAKIDQAKKQAVQAKAAMDFAQKQNQRDQALAKTGAGTEEAAQQAASTYIQDQAAYASAQANTIAAEKQSAVLEAGKKSSLAQLQQAKANQHQAEVTLSRTQITAPVDGYATAISAATGAYAQPGQALMMFVPKTVWITANFKETQLDLMRPGQPVEIRIDAYPDHTFHGHVDSIQAGSGTAFSLLPPQNATGNYVKVVQRVPVKIVFDKQPDVYLGPGMSVVPKVKVR